mgnify:CR=1 FL=1
MILLSLVAFVVAALAAGLIVRWMGRRASVYGNGMPQCFHLGDVPRVGGVAVLLGMCCSWGLGVVQSQWWGDSGSLRLGGWVGLWRPIVRTALLCLVIPAVIWDADQRGLHGGLGGDRKSVV